MVVCQWVCIVLGARGELGLREQCDRCFRCLGMLVLVGKALGPGNARSSGWGEVGSRA